MVETVKALCEMTQWNWNMVHGRFLKLVVVQQPSLLYMLSPSVVTDSATQKVRSFSMHEILQADDLIVICEVKEQSYKQKNPSTAKILNKRSCFMHEILYAHDLVVICEVDEQLQKRKKI